MSLEESKNHADRDGSSDGAAAANSAAGAGAGIEGVNAEVAGGVAADSAGASADGAAKAKKSRVILSAEEKIKQAKEAAAEKAKKDAELLEKKLQKIRLEAVPLGKRKSTAFDLIEKLRAQVRSVAGNSTLDDVAADAHIERVVTEAFQAKEIAPAT